MPVDKVAGNGEETEVGTPDQLCERESLIPIPELVEDLGFILLLAALVLYSFVFGVSIELPDAEADRVGGKLNLVSRFGWRGVSSASPAPMLGLYGAPRSVLGPQIDGS